MPKNAVESWAAVCGWRDLGSAVLKKCSDFISAHGLHYHAVVGHLRIQKPAPNTGSYEWDSNSSLAVRRHKGKIRKLLGFQSE